MATRKTKKKLKKTFIFIILLIVIILGIIIFNGYSMYKSAVSNISIEDRINQIKSSPNYIKIENVSNWYKEAVIAVEDHRFYQHKGFDIRATVNALFHNLKTRSLGMGGSTITQQLAKNMYFSQKKEFSRKIAELFVANSLESKYSKDEILELYINIIYFGDGYYGIKEASNGYYKKNPINLNKEESIMLAGLPAAPSMYSPTVNKDLANQRYKQVEAAVIKYSNLEK